MLSKVYLRESGMADAEVIHVESLAEAMKSLAQGPADIILTDLGLPDADAAYTAGSNPESVRVQKAKKKGASRGRKK